MSSSFKIAILILGGWTLLSLVCPPIAGIIGILALSALPFYFSYSGVRDGFISARYGFRSHTFERNREPFFFWLVVMFFALTGIIAVGIAIWLVLENYHRLLLK